MNDSSMKIEKLLQDCQVALEVNDKMKKINSCLFVFSMSKKYEHV